MFNNRLFIVVIFCALCAGHPRVFAQLPTNDDPHNQIRFRTAEDAEQRREKLIRFVWEDGLPTKVLPEVKSNVTSEALSTHLELLDANLIRNIDRLEVEVLGLNSLIYFISPSRSSDIGRLVILHAGHSGSNLNESYQSTIQFFLARGYRVMMVHMPMYGWNDDITAVLSDGTEVVLDDPDVKKHEQIVRLVDLDETLAQGAGFRPFLEPVVTCINYWLHLSEGEPDVTMIGLSGGGWTTHMMAAVDTRIVLSFPVAGSYPLYLRNISGYAGSVGDMEQFYGPLYNENIAPDGTGGGVATWLEIYALGGLGKERRQIMVTAQYDNCCFNGDPAQTVDTFKSVVADAVEDIDPGLWQHRLDTTHREHKISPWVLQEVVEPNVLP